MFRSFDKGQTGVPWLPPMGPGLLLRALFKRRRAACAGQAVQLASRFVAAPAGRAGIEAYNAALGFAPGATPLTWYYLMVQRAHLATMLSPDFPCRIAGMVHVDNALVLHGAPARGPIALSTRLALQAPAANGAVYCALETEGRCADQPVFSCTSTYLAVRGKRRGGGPRPAAVPGETMASWTLAPSAGRAYARVSGDWNPIHLARWTARLMGLRSPIIHGMHSVGSACARLEAAAGRPVNAISARFLAPVPLGATVALAVGAEPGSYALYAGGVLAAEGRYSLG